MRFATLILFYDCDQFILRAIENCAPHVEKIYVTYSPLPWGYNSKAREKFRNPSDPSIVQQSKFLDKVELIEGDWFTEEEQRNEVLDKAKAEGFDYLIIQDADEFFHAEDYSGNLRQIEANPDYSFYRTPWYQFWKTTEWILRCKISYCYKQDVPIVKLKNTLISFSMAFAINLKTNTSFERCRRPNNIDDYLILDGPAYHLSYVLSDGQVERKIQTYGHSQQIRHKRWLRNKWYGWQPQTKRLHPLAPHQWLHAEPYKGNLPKEIKDLPLPEQQHKTLSRYEKMFALAGDLEDYVIRCLKQFKKKILKLLFG